MIIFIENARGILASFCSFPLRPFCAGKTYYIYFKQTKNTVIYVSVFAYQKKRHKHGFSRWNLKKFFKDASNWCKLQLILACPYGHFGYDCKEKCNINCGVPEKCDRESGECSGGCQDGWRGPRCDQSILFISDFFMFDIGLFMYLALFNFVFPS